MFLLIKKRFGESKILKAHIFEVCKLASNYYCNKFLFYSQHREANLAYNIFCEEKDYGKRVPGRTKTDGKVMMCRGQKS